MIAETPAKASQNEFWSVDSQPALLSGPVSLWRAPAVILLCVVLSGLGLCALNTVPILTATFPLGDWIIAEVPGETVISIRQFMLSFFIAFAFFANGSFGGRLIFGSKIVASFVVICGFIDLFFGTFLPEAFGYLPTVLVVQIVAGLSGFGLFAFWVFHSGKMPAHVTFEPNPARPLQDYTRFAVVFLTSAVLSWWVGNQDLDVVHWLRDVALLGGIGPGVFLFLPAFFLQLYILAQFDRLRQEVQQEFQPDISIVIPAHNEEYIIAQTINAIERAAQIYQGRVFVIVVNNNSSDKTTEVTKQAFLKCQTISGTVLEEPNPGKSHALNSGFAAVQTEFSIRIDADTQIAPDALLRAMQHFSDPHLGCLGGVPDTVGGSLFQRARLVEVFVNHGYYSIATEAIDGLVAIPGMFAVYRAKLPLQLGGFAFGLNGEDSDMSMRIAELGYRLTVDPRVRYVSEVPSTYSHMREQRMRWFRSAFHITARCRDAMPLLRGSLRGMLVLRIMLINSAIRAMMLPLLLFGIFEYIDLYDTGIRPLWTSLAAVILGAPLIIAVLSILINRTPKALLNLPEYTLFRLLRGYLTLESLLSISIGDGRDKVKKSQ